MGENDDFNNYCWYMRIIYHDINKEWFLGVSLDNYKIFNECYDYDEPMKVDCLYYFHKNSITEIPTDWGNKNEEKLIKEINPYYERGITGHINVEEDKYFKTDMYEVLSKFNN